MDEGRLSFVRSFCRRGKASLKTVLKAKEMTANEKAGERNAAPSTPLFSLIVFVVNVVIFVAFILDQPGISMAYRCQT